MLPKLDLIKDNYSKSVTTDGTLVICRYALL